MAIRKNLSTPENRVFWRSIEETARQVEHWPKWQGGDGKEPICCARCNRPVPGKETVSIKILNRDAYIQMPLKTWKKIKAEFLKMAREATSE
jgi:hypothetical protein